ncbi:hypothetical protein H101_03909, partial [Trichophyton interdigitale H6]
PGIPLKQNKAARQDVRISQWQGGRRPRPAVSVPSIDIACSFSSNNWSILPHQYRQDIPPRLYSVYKLNCSEEATVSVSHGNGPFLQHISGNCSLPELACGHGFAASSLDIVDCGKKSLGARKQVRGQPSVKSEGYNHQ